MTWPAIDPAWINWAAQLYARRSARHDLAASLGYLLKRQGIEVARPRLVWRTKVIREFDNGFTAALGRIYERGLAGIDWDHEPTDIRPIRNEFLAWYAKAAEIVLFAHKINKSGPGRNAHCYIDGGFAAIENAEQFLAFGSIAIRDGRIA